MAYFRIRKLWNNNAKKQIVLQKYSYAYESGRREGRFFDEILASALERRLTHERRIVLEKGENRTWEFSKRYVSYIRIVFDSDLERKFQKDSMLKLFPMLAYNGSKKTLRVPPTLVKQFRIRWRAEGGWREQVFENNFQRLVKIPVGEKLDAVEFCGMQTHGATKVYLWTLDIEE